MKAPKLLRTALATGLIAASVPSLSVRANAAWGGWSHWQWGYVGVTAPYWTQYHYPYAYGYGYPYYGYGYGYPAYSFGYGYGPSYGYAGYGYAYHPVRRHVYAAHGVRH